MWFATLKYRFGVTELTVELQVIARCWISHTFAETINDSIYNTRQGRKRFHLTRSIEEIALNMYVVFTFMFCLNRTEDKYGSMYVGNHSKKLANSVEINVWKFRMRWMNPGFTWGWMNTGFTWGEWTPALLEVNEHWDYIYVNITGAGHHYHVLRNKTNVEVCIGVITRTHWALVIVNISFKIHPSTDDLICHFHFAIKQCNITRFFARRSIKSRNEAQKCC